MILDWNSIRPLSGGRDKGFEELCAQLARAESPAGSEFVRKGTPDAGVECYAVLQDKSEWGWQAKYFDTLGDTQWPQLDDSVKTVIEKHPKLVRYFICVPLDRPDARIDGRKSAKDRWDDHVKKWTKWASERGMTVDFVYWGSHELLERLARPENVGRVRFWFGVRGFDSAWFSARLDEAIRTAGPRYTPEIHIDLPIMGELEAFGRTSRFFAQVKSHARKIREKIRTVEHREARTADPVLDSSAATLSAKIQTILAGFGAIEPQPIGVLPFKKIAEHIREAEALAEEYAQALAEREREHEVKPAEATDSSNTPLSYRSNPFRDRRFRLLDLSSVLRSAREALEHAEGVASASVMILRGAAGTGKSHLLCDFARHRVAADHPTVLLMGQRFVSTDAPWLQTLQQLDTMDLSAEEFIGALESVAQAAGSRALLLIDAVNEGAGRTIWPSHLAAFLAQIQRSPWIGVVLAVRSSYEEIVIPEEVRARATTVTHEGFRDHEYDATKTFFVHYDLELPSTPLLAPEFRNPLFLKTLCQGLNVQGERRLPRGFHGITAVFNLYLSAVNKRLASTLGFDARTPLVRQALEAVAKSFLDTGKQSLTLIRAGEIVNALLPGREFERSLYRGLVVEGILVEEAPQRYGTEPDEIVFISYERFADHLAAKILLDSHLDIRNPTLAFEPGGPLAFICNEQNYVSPGLLEALCIQVPERTGQELVSIAPLCANRWGMGEAFRQSIIWRSYAAFSDGTTDALNEFCRNEDDLHDTLNTLLTVATLPGHPLNALFLDGRLRKDSMPDRDAWWSVYLHHAWGNHDAVDRLVDWASSLSLATSIDDETVDLCAISLSWMFTTSNRFLRDRATLALVTLLTGRLAAAVRLIERFADVDDLYVAERIYAVAYGTAMRCHDPVALATLATCVYDQIFAAGNPAPHILLRDYARGVVERAIYIGATIDVVIDRIRPPYRSEWPVIPTEEEIKPLLPDWSRGSHDSGELEWGWNRIGNSVMDDDFARYVIGTNSSVRSSTWLSLRLDEPQWQSPSQAENLLLALIAEFSDEERQVWEQFSAADKALDEASQPFIADWFRQRQEASDGDEVIDYDALAKELEEAYPPKIAALGENRKDAFAALDAVLSEDHAQRLIEIWDSQEGHRDEQRPPRFDLRQLQRYILWRVFNLGWTMERFGYFDRFSIGYKGREASKAERIGKKYQWIAYHEIIAYLSDHFQYQDEFTNKRKQAYEGPWQIHLRDIDPSCTMRSIPGGTSLDGHSTTWWGSFRYNHWGNPSSIDEWILSIDDLPKLDELLVVTNPIDGSQWLNGQGFFMWRQQPPVDRDSTDVEHRELWYIATGYLIQEDEAQLFLEWAESADFSGNWMPDAPEVHEMFLGEHLWAPAAHYIHREIYGEDEIHNDDGWRQPGKGCPVKIRATTLVYLRQMSSFDCSIDEGYTLQLPVSEIIEGLGLRWTGVGADFIDSAGQVAVQDPTVYADGPNALLLRADLLKKFLARKRLTICWVVRGEKRALSPGFRVGSHSPWLRMTGAYVFSEGKLNGFMRHILDNPNNSERFSDIKIVRTD